RQPEKFASLRDQHSRVDIVLRVLKFRGDELPPGRGFDRAFTLLHQVDRCRLASCRVLREKSSETISDRVEPRDLGRFQCHCHSVLTVRAAVAVLLSWSHHLHRRELWIRRSSVLSSVGLRAY